MKRSLLLCLLFAAPLLVAQQPEMEKPGPHHQILKMMAGTWDAKFKMHMGPDQVMESTGVEVSKLQPGGFWLISDFTGKFVDMDFHGHAVLGYEVHKKQYSGLWVDSVASVMLISKGTSEKDGKVNVMIGSCYDPMKKRNITFKQVTEIKDANTKLFRMYDVQDNKETLIMEAVYKRRPEKPATAPKTPPKAEGSFSHIISGPLETPYYISGPQQARPPEGKFKPGTRVQLLREAGSYCQVLSETGIRAYVATGVLKAIDKK